MELAIRHFIPGRVRLHVPSICRRRSLAEASAAWLRGVPGIKSVRINYDCACFVIEYDVAQEALLRTMIGRLRLMSHADLRALVAPAESADDRPATSANGGDLDATRSLLRRVPLALPTLSVALAFGLNPIFRAINLPLMLWNAYPIALRAWRVWQREGRLNVDFLDTLAVAASLAQGNPMTGAIVTWLITALRTKAKELAVNIPPCDETQYRIGLGVEGQVNGYYLHVGNERFMQRSSICVRKAVADRASLDEQGLSCLYIAVDGVLAGMVPYSDEIRPESRSALRQLRDLGIKETVMLTGDNAVVACAVSRRLGLTRHFADMLPAEKAEVIQELQRSGNVVAMVGDGINDSPALSYADVGIAMKHGAEVTHESAHVVLMDDSLWKLVKAVEISQGAIGLIKQNYAIVAGMNTLALALALPGGLITPTMTALISNGSAVLATLNGLRPILRRP